MDLAVFSSIDSMAGSTEGRWMTVVDFNGSPLLSPKNKTPVRLLFAGVDSIEYKAARRAMNREAADLAADDDAKSFKPTDEIMVQRGYDAATKLIVSCLKDWEGIEDSKGKPLQYERAGGEQLIATYPSIRDQADNFVTSRANFTKAS